MTAPWMMNDVPAIEPRQQILEGHIEQLYPPRYPKTQRWSVVPTPERHLSELDDELEPEAIEALRQKVSGDWLRFYRSLYEKRPTFSVRGIAPDGSVWISPDPFDHRQDAQDFLSTIERQRFDWDRTDFVAAGWDFQNRLRDDQPFTFVKVRRLDGRQVNVAIWDLEGWGFFWVEKPTFLATDRPGYLGLELGQTIRWQVKYSPYNGHDQWTLTSLQ